jgi:hypothetical protein
LQRGLVGQAKVETSSQGKDTHDQIRCEFDLMLVAKLQRDGALDATDDDQSARSEDNEDEGTNDLQMLVRKTGSDAYP